MFGTKELQNKVSELTELNTGYVAQIEELNAKLEELSGVKAHNTELQENMKLVNTQNEELTEKVKTLEDGQSDFDTKVASAAQNIVAQAGHEPIEEVEEDQTASVVETYKAMSAGPKRDAFYKANKKELFKALGK